MSERPVVYRVSLLLPGSAESLTAWAEALPDSIRIEGEALHTEGLELPGEVEWIPSDGTFGGAFGFGNVPEETVAAIQAAPGALLLHLPVDLRESRDLILAIVKGLQQAGALGVRLEQSHLGWEISQWLELLSSSPMYMHQATILFLSTETFMQSCGMHAFSLPDVRIEIDDEDRDALQNMGAILNLFQILEDPPLLSGHTFSPSPDQPKRPLERWPDLRYPPGHDCHNPYGVWRMGPAGGAAREVDPKPAVFVPALIVLLTAMQQKQDEPLTQEQVERLRDDAACVTMEPAQAHDMERTRGYADLNPEFAWEQWQAIQAQRAE